MGVTGNAMAADALGALLDRSLVQMAEASADARTYDRRTIHAVSDVWDNNTFPLFRAFAARTSWGRERRARATLAWMAALGGERRTWMVEQAAIAGYDLESLLSVPVTHQRDHRRIVRAPLGALTAEVAAEIGVDYDLAAAEVRSLVLERIGARLTGTLVVAVRRWHASERPAELRIWLDEVTDAHFDSRDSSGITMDCGTGQIAIGVGGRGLLCAADATVHLDDLSAAGRVRDVRTSTSLRTTSRRTRPRRRQEPLEDGALAAATILHQAMLEIRMVRYAHLAGQIPVRSLCLAFAGAGESILAASRHRRASMREEAFRRLVDDWVRKGGPDLAPWFAGQLASPGCGTNREWVNSLSFQPGGGAKSDLPVEAELRLAEFTRCEHPRAGSALVLLAVPPRPQAGRDEVWGLCGLKLESPQLFQVSSVAFHGATEPHLMGRSLRLSGGGLIMSADEAETRG
ncbi:hypothetical protein GCM10009850_106260 [Nonomuraea monospora]|uniref:Uncharacterized protein n=1 Tax=Nonomuraea monospora TaxID=568818 RepID=A0ABP5PU23_9ACTN